MKAPAFDYVRPGTLAEAIALLARDPNGAKLVAGGQSLLPALNLRLSAPALLIDIARLPELHGIALAGDSIRIGAATTHAQLAAHPLVATHLPLLARAMAHVAHPAIRTRGTIGGSLANADPAAELPACALALAATLLATGPAGQRRISVDAFFTGLFETALAPDEVLTAIEIPLPAAGSRWGFEELARRSGDYAIVGLAALHPPGAAPRLAWCAVGATATLAPRAAAALAPGLDATTIAAACSALAHDLSPHADLQATAATRLHLARTLLRRVLTGWTMPESVAA